MYGGAAASGLFWGMSASDIAVMLSAFVAFLGFCVHTWATIRKDQREARQYEAHEAREEERHEAIMAAGEARGEELHAVHEQTTRIESKIDEA